MMKWKSTERVLYRNANVHSSVSPFATAMLVNGDEIAWLGEESAVAAHHDSADRVLDMNGSYISPVFVDAHCDALENDSLGEARGRAASMGIGAFHDFSKTPATDIEHGILNSPGALVYAFREKIQGGESGFVTRASQLASLPAGILGRVPISITCEDPQTEQLLHHLDVLASSIGYEALKAADIRVDGLSVIDEAQLRALEYLGVSIIANIRTMTSASTAIGVGASLAFGSFNGQFANPWETIRAAVFEFPQDQRLTARAAFSAATRGGWRSAGRGHIGVIAPGAPAHFAVWEAGDVVVQTPDERVSGWSTDPRSGTPGLPDVTPGLPLPECLRTVIAGAVVFDRGNLPT